MLLRRKLLLITATCGLAAPSCRTISNEWTARRDASTAHNQMMLVRQNPDTLGYRRLVSKSEQLGDLKIFIEQKGMPDFLAEATSGNREYLMFYYLDRRQAFACRTSGIPTGQIEFAGPYKMTVGELRLLKAAKAKANQVSANG